jgi:tryptophan-rich sensory protein
MRWLALLVAVIIPQVVAALSAWSTFGAVRDWYPSLVRPVIAPPSWVFGPVWTLLYLMMGIASWLVWERRDRDPRAGLALGLYAAQLVVNGVWSPVFFTLHALGWAVVVIVILWVLIAATLRAFWQVARPAGAMLVPYLLWVTFATALNVEFWRLNR